MNTVGIIGYGRFGKVLATILQKGFSINIYDVKPSNSLDNISFVTLDEVLNERVIFIAVPIHNFENLLKKISKAIKINRTIIDVCSVKIHTAKVMLKYLPSGVGILSSHPMFGPDSILTNEKLKMMMHRTRDCHNQYSFWEKYFKDQNIEILNMSPEKHDKLAARTQGITHFLGRSLKKFGISKTNIDTQGFRVLLNLVDQTCNDSWELYSDLQSYNPYTKDMIHRLKKSFEEVEGK
jgi:prephenate dehydrogenase|tara:strand:- start:6354 stop:7064 length:711 start_codon:yes stop_codon:yes gene_type:complete